MADLVITAANVVPDSGYSSQTGVAAGTITAGQVVYKRASDGKWTPADATSLTTAGVGAQAFGIALNGASAGQPVTVMTGGNVTIGATIVQGGLYILSATGGGGNIAPFADFSGMAAGRVFVELGAGLSTTKLAMNIQNYSGAVVHA